MMSRDSSIGNTTNSVNCSLFLLQHINAAFVGGGVCHFFKIIVNCYCMVKSCVIMLKGTVHPKIKILSSCNYPHVIPNLKTFEKIFC